MPPKPKFTKDEVVMAALEIAKRSGMDAVVAREVARQLGATTGPIFTYYATMDELKEDAYKMAVAECKAYMSECMNYTPAFKEFGLRWIRYAKENPNLYALLFMMKGAHKRVKGVINEDFADIVEPMSEEIRKAFGVEEKDAIELLNTMLVYAHGIAALEVNGLITYTEKELSEQMSIMCLSIVQGLKIKSGTFNLKQAEAMLADPGAMPRSILH